MIKSGKVKATKQLRTPAAELASALETNPYMMQTPFTPGVVCNISDLKRNSRNPNDHNCHHDLRLCDI